MNFDKIFVREKNLGMFWSGLFSLEKRTSKLINQ